MNYTGRKSWARVGVRREPGAVDESGLSGPVKTYKLPPEEIEKIFQDVKPEPCPEMLKAMVGYRDANKANEVEEIDPGIESIFTEEDYVDSEWGGPFEESSN